MKRRMTGEIKVIGYYPVTNTATLYLLPFEMADYWEDKKGNSAIALLWQDKICFRTLYYRANGVCFKFFNEWIYLSGFARTGGTHDYITV